MTIHGKEVNGRLVITASRPQSYNNKYRAIKKTVDGIRFDSTRESERYILLKHLLKLGEIRNLELQVKYPIIINGELICTYIADFVYLDVLTGKTVVEDSKGMITPVYRLKKKLMRIVNKIEIVEV